jgi:hypothetical protein
MKQKKKSQSKRSNKEETQRMMQLNKDHHGGQAKKFQNVQKSHLNIEK